MKLARDSSHDLVHHLLTERMELLAKAEPKPVSDLRLRSDCLPRLDLQGEGTGIDPSESREPTAEADDNWDPIKTAGHCLHTERGSMWLAGNSLLFQCPTCTAPMTVRLWLRLADCWRCQSSIALGEQEVRQAQALIAQAREESPETERDRLPVPYLTPALQADPPEHAEVELPDSRTRELQQLTERSVLASFVRRGFRITPAWVISLILHTIVILILALIVLRDDELGREAIVLSTTIDSMREPGGELRLENPLDRLQDNLPIASELVQADRELRNVMLRAMQDARELRIDPNPTAPRMELNVLRQNVTTRPDQRMSFDARDPRVRAEIVRREGGTMMTEAAVARGLRWLASVQNQDGSWSLRDYHKHDRLDNEGDAMATSLALLPFLGAGQTHEHGRYKQTVSRGLKWLIEKQKRDGDLRAGFRGQAGMYAHGQAAIVLCEALAMTGDEAFRVPAQRSIRFIERAQHDEGGWRYRPGQAGDTSVFGWQLMALQSARAPRMGLQVDKSTLKLADYFLDLVAVDYRHAAREGCPEGALYCYQPGRNCTAAMTAEAILCRMYLGWTRDDPRLRAAIDWLIEEHLPDEDEKNIYYWYYGTQTLHHYGGRPWEKWNSKMRELLIATQDTGGRHPGSWNPRGFRWGGQGGRIYTTALAICTLEVYYRHLPLFKQIKLED